MTEAIWRDMQSFEGYLSHELLVDADDPGHLLVVSQWTSREHADETLRLYATQGTGGRRRPHGRHDRRWHRASSLEGRP